MVCPAWYAAAGQALAYGRPRAAPARVLTPQRAVPRVAWSRGRLFRVRRPSDFRALTRRIACRTRGGSRFAPLRGITLCALGGARSLHFLYIIAPEIGPWGRVRALFRQRTASRATWPDPEQATSGRWARDAQEVCGSASWHRPRTGRLPAVRSIMPGNPDLHAWERMACPLAVRIECFSGASREGCARVGLATGLAGGEWAAKRKARKP